MKVTFERTQFEPNYREGVPVSWNVAFEIETDTGVVLFAPILIEYRDVPTPVTEAAVTIRAFQEVMSSQLWHLYKDVNVLTEMDELAAEIFKEEHEAKKLEDHVNKVTEENKQLVERAKERLEAAKVQRAANEARLVALSEERKSEGKDGGLPIDKVPHRESRTT